LKLEDEVEDEEDEGTLFNLFKIHQEPTNANQNTHFDGESVVF